MLTNSPAVGKGLPLTIAKADLLENCYALHPTLGAFEALPAPTPPLDTDGDLLPDAWEDANGLNRNDPADANQDFDRDGFSNGAEFLAGTDPKNPGSIFDLSDARVDDDGFVFRYPTLTARTYTVQTRSLGVGPWMDIAVTNGTGNLVEYREPIAAAIDKLFRVKIQPLR